MAQRNSWASQVIWGAVAVCAVLAAAVTIALVVSSHRGIPIAAPAKQMLPAAAPVPGQVQAQPPAPAGGVAGSSREHEIARLNDALRTLAAERDRLADRLETVERTLGDITASVRKRATAVPEKATTSEIGSTADAAMKAEARIAEPPPPPQRIAAAPTQPLAPAPARGSAPAAGAVVMAPGEIFQPYATVQPAVAPPVGTQAPMQIHAYPQVAATAAPQAASAAVPGRESVATRTEFALDLGSEPNMDALRARWANLRGNYGAVLEPLRPLVSVREGNRPGSVELRLIAGPVANAADAARVCASLQAKGVNCQTAVFDGQRLALR